MRTYDSTIAEIEKIEAEQRAIIDKETPCDSDADSLLKAEGELAALRKFAHELHTREIEETRASAETATTVTATDDPWDAANEAFRNMPRGEERALASGSTPGSYLVPQEWHDRVREYRFGANFLRQAGAEVVRTDSTHNIPILSALATAAIVSEATAYTDSDPNLAQVILSAYKLTLKSNVSEELLADSAYDVASMLARATGLAFGRGEEKEFLTGNGSSKPTGIFNKAADKTLNSASAITKNELIEIVYALKREYRDGAGWMMNDATTAYIAKLQEDITSSGTMPYWWTDSREGEPPRLLGYPVYTSSHIATIASSAKVITFGNPQFYVIGERGPMVAKRLQLNEHSDTFAWHHRIDGKPLIPEAFQVVAMGA